MFNVRCGWIQHEAGHNSFTTNTKIDKLIQTLTVGLGLSTCGYQWNKVCPYSSDAEKLSSPPT